MLCLLNARLYAAMLHFLLLVKVRNTGRHEG